MVAASIPASSSGFFEPETGCRHMPPPQVENTISRPSGVQSSAQGPSVEPIEISNSISRGERLLEK